MTILTGVKTILSAAHYSKEGVLHGHTWSIVGWVNYAGESAEIIQQRLKDYISTLDHSVLPNEIAWGEALAEKIGLDMGFVRVDVSRDSEGIYARWER